MTKTIKAADFERSLKRLEGIVRDLEEGNLSLDEALKKYEEGIELARSCSRLLKEARGRVQRLVKKEGVLTTEELNQEAVKQDVSGED